METKQNIYFGIEKNGNIIVTDSENKNKFIYTIVLTHSKTTPKGFDVYEYSVFSKEILILDRVISWGNMKYKLAERDTWDTIDGSAHKSLILKLIINEQVEISIESVHHSTKMINEISTLITFFKSHNGNSKL